MYVILGNLQSSLILCSTRPNETRTHSCRFASLACYPLHHQRIYVCHHCLEFSNSVFVFFSIALNNSKHISTTGDSSYSCIPFFMLFIHSAFLSCSFSFYILLQNLFFPLHLVTGLFSCIQRLLLGRICFLFLNGFFCLYCLTLSCYLLSIPSFANIFWFISSIFIIFCCFILVYSSRNTRLYFSLLSTCFFLFFVFFFGLFVFCFFNFLT